MIFFKKNVSRPSNPPDELAQNVSKKNPRRTNYSSIFLQKFRIWPFFNYLHYSNSIFRAWGINSELFSGCTVINYHYFSQFFRFDGIFGLLRLAKISGPRTSRSVHCLQEASHSSLVLVCLHFVVATQTAKSCFHSGSGAAVNGAPRLCAKKTMKMQSAQSMQTQRRLRTMLLLKYHDGISGRGRWRNVAAVGSNRLARLGTLTSSEADCDALEEVYGHSSPSRSRLDVRAVRSCASAMKTGRRRATGRECWRCWTAWAKSCRTTRWRRAVRTALCDSTRQPGETLRQMVQRREQQLDLAAQLRHVLSCNVRN